MDVELLEMQPQDKQNILAMQGRPVLFAPEPFWPTVCLHINSLEFPNAFNGFFHLSSFFSVSIRSRWKTNSKCQLENQLWIGIIELFQGLRRRWWWWRQRKKFTGSNLWSWLAVTCVFPLIIECPPCHSTMEIVHCNVGCTHRYSNIVTRHMQPQTEFIP